MKKKTKLENEQNSQTTDNQLLIKKEEKQNTEKPETIPAAQSKTEEYTPEIQNAEEQPSVNPLQIPFANLDALRESVRENEKIRAAARKEVEKATIHTLWNEYADQCVSKSLQTALKTTILDYNKELVSIKTPSNLMRDMILQEKGLMDFIREKTGVVELSFHISVDRSLFPSYEEAQPTQPVTQKEKYLAMLEKNTSLGSLTKKLGLKLDNEMRGE